MGCSEGVAKCILLLFNTVFLLSGAAVLGVGIWVKVDKSVVNLQHLVEFDSSDKQLDTAAYVLIGFGAFVFLVSLLGFLTVCCTKITQCFVITYIACLVIICIGEIAGGALAAVYKGKVEDELSKSLNKSLTKYEPGDNLNAKAWNYVQVLFKCCGKTSNEDYQHVNFTGHCSVAHVTCKVPDSCCVLQNKDPEKPMPTNVTLCQQGNKEYVHTNGCYDTIKDEIKSHLTVLVGIGIGIAFVEILGIILACIVLKSERDSY